MYEHPAAHDAAVVSGNAALKAAAQSGVAAVSAAVPVHAGGTAAQSLRPGTITDHARPGVWHTLHGMS